MITRDTTKRTVHEPCEKEEVRRGGSRLYRRSGSGRKRFLIGWKKRRVLDLGGRECEIGGKWRVPERGVRERGGKGERGGGK